MSIIKGGTNVFEIIFPNLKIGKHEFELLLDPGTYTFERNLLLGAGKIDYSVILFGGQKNTPYNVLVFNPNFSLTNITNVMSSYTDFIGMTGTIFTLNEKSNINIVVYINEHPIIDEVDPKLIIILNKS